MASRSSNAAFRVDIDQSDLRALVAALKELEGGKKMVSALRKNLKAAADPMKQQVMANAGWSSRIPGAVGVQVRFTAKVVGVSVFVSRTKAPHARPIENSGKAGTFQHPVFGTSTEAKQAARPFFFSQLAQHMPQVEKAVGESVDEAAKAAGFR